MTAYNREKYISEATESVLSDSYTDFELIIVDDCSKDKTLEIARSFEMKDSRVRVYVNEKNLGDYPNRSKAASYANGKYIKYLDSDDFIYYHGLEVMVNSMERFPEAGFGMLSRGDYVSPYPKVLSPRETYLEHFDGYGHLNRAPGSAIINLKVFKELNGFSGRNLIGDVEFWFKIARAYPMVKICDDLYWPRSHDDQQKDSISGDKYDALRIEIVENALTNPQCPLTIEDIGFVIKLIKKNKWKTQFLKNLSKVKKIFYS